MEASFAKSSCCVLPGLAHRSRLLVLACIATCTRATRHCLPPLPATPVTRYRAAATPLNAPAAIACPSHHCHSYGAPRCLRSIPISVTQWAGQRAPGTPPRVRDLASAPPSACGRTTGRSRLARARGNCSERISLREKRRNNRKVTNA
jgi:hypothetical protein